MGRANVPVILLAEPPLHADIMMSSSMMVSLIWGLPDCTTKTSFSRTLVKMRTLVSPFENWDSSADAGAWPRFSQILPERAGHDEPEKMSVFRMTK
jgi:hypothetical protein